MQQFTRKEGRWVGRRQLEHSTTVVLHQDPNRHSPTLFALYKIANSSLKVWNRRDSLPPGVHKAKWCELFSTLQHCSEVCSDREEVTAFCKFINLCQYEKAMMSWSIRRKWQDGRLMLFLDKTLKVLSVVTWNYGFGLTGKLAMVSKLKIYFTHKLKISNISDKICPFLIPF